MSSPSVESPRGSSATSEPTSFQLALRMLGLAWRYRWACVWLLSLQATLLFFTINSLRLLGAGIDLIRHLSTPGVARPSFPFGFGPSADLTPMAQVRYVATTLLIVELARAAINFVFIRSQGWTIHARIVPELRWAMYDKLQRLSFRFFDKNATGTIMNRVTSDAHSVRAFIDGVLIQVVLLIGSIGAYLVTLIQIHPWLTLACLSTTPVLGIATHYFSRRVRPMYDRNRDLVDDLVLRLSENVQGVQVIKGFGREGQEIEKFAKGNESVRDQQRGIFWLVSVYTPAVGFLTQFNMTILMGYGGWLMSRGDLTIGSGIVVFAGLLQQLSSQVANITNITNTIQQSLTAAKRVFEILDAPVETKSKPDAIPLARARGEIEFQNVSFAYGTGPLVLKDVSFRVSLGESLAILGATGAGKSTLFALLCRFYDPTEGRVLLDGVDLRDYRLEDLRRNVGLVFQETFLFGNTAAANIAFGRPEASDERVREAARIAAADEFIAKLPDGYDTLLGESGLDLSGGQRQRLAIARAVLTDPSLLLLDDPAAAVDPHTEEEILGAIDGAMQGRTTLVIAHRLSTLRRCDRAIVLEHGRIVQSGRHDELMRVDGHFREAAEAQLGAVRTLREIAAEDDSIEEEIDVGP